MKMTDSHLLIGALALGSFFTGSIPFAYIFARLYGGIDIREHGSGNPGASNVYRVIGPVPGIIVFILDTLKGALPVLLVGRLIQNDYSLYYEISAGFLTAAGHIWSPFLRFQGGKGVATSLGIFIIIFPEGIVMSAVLAAIAILVTRIFSVGSLIGAVFLPVSYFIVYWKDPWNSKNSGILILSLLSLILIVYRHRDNLKRLRQGKEFQTRNW